VRLLLAGLLLLALGSPALAQEGAPVTVRAELDRTQMTIGDQALLTLVVDLAPGHDLGGIGVPRQIGDFEVVEALTVLQTRAPSGATRVQLRYLVTAFELGPHVLPAIAVEYRSPDGSTGRAQSAGERVIEVVSVVTQGEDASDIKPLKPPLPLPAGTLTLLREWAPLVAAAFAIGAAVALAIRMLRRAPLLEPEIAHGPARRALDELEAIVERRLPEEGRTREHYELVSAVLRRYAEERFRVAAHARTARELRRELERSGADRAQIQVMFDALHDAESVRYEEQVVYPARAQKTMRDLLDTMRRSVAAEEYELIESGAAT
jgi:hypothetical protein